MRSWLCLIWRDSARWPVVAGESRAHARPVTDLFAAMTPQLNSESIANFSNHLAAILAQRAVRAVKLKPILINSEKAWI